MAFKPKNANRTENSGDFEPRNFPVPKSGARRARVSLIVDLGEQNRESIWKKGDTIVTEDTEGAVEQKQKPCQQVAVFADLVNDLVDYGGDVGKAHYRLLLNNSFAGKLKGINFAASPPKDAKGKTIEGKKWGFHPQNLLTKLANAVGKPEVVESMDIEELLGEQFIAEVEVKETKSGKNDKDGVEIVYKNVNFKKASQVPAEVKEDDEGNEEEVVPTFAALKMEPKAITFTNATKDDIKFIRANIIKQIKLANDYAGSQMQKAIEAFEAEQGNKTQDDVADDDVAPSKPAAKPAAKKAEKKLVPQEDMDEDVPF
jgi:hypothetical protein